MIQGLNWGKISRAAVLLVVLGLLAFILLRVRHILTPFLIALIITYVLGPMVDYGENRGLSRGQSIAVTYLILIALVALLVIYVAPVLFLEINRLVANLPSYIEDTQGALMDFEGYYASSAVPESVREAINQSIETNLERIEEHTVSVLGGLVTGVVGFFGGLFNVVLGPILAAYMLKDFRKFHEYLENVFAPDRREHVKRFLADVDRVLGGFFHGRLIISLMVGIATAVILGLMGLRFAVLLGIFAGLTNLIPYFGPFIGAVPALLLAGFESRFMLIQVGILYLVIQQLDGFVLSPKILGVRTGLHPLAVIFAVMAGGVLFGFWGLFLGVPVAAFLKVCIDHVIVWVASP